MRKELYLYEAKKMKSQIIPANAKPKIVKITVEGKRISIPVPPAVKAYFDAQFSRENPSELQKKRYKTLTKLMEMAFIEGQKSMKDAE